MRRILATLTVLTVAGFAAADIPIPPPQGKKFIDVKSTVKLGIEAKGYVFFTRADAPGQWGVEPKKLELSADKAVALPEWGRRPMDLFAVPVDAVAKYKTAKDWNDAINGKKDGILRYTFPAQETVDKVDSRKVIEREFVIQSLNKEDGIVLEEKADGKKEYPEVEKKDKEERASVSEPRYLIAGVAVAAGVALAGLWAVRRRKA
jgi:hypothetical protein